jgi:hypothetical protein
MTDSVYRHFGDTEFPQDLTASPETLFASLDPQLDAILALFKAALNAELGAAWDLARVGTALEFLKGTMTASTPVVDTLWTQPTKASLRAQSLGFPLLCLARVSTTNEELTLSKEMVSTTWALDYLLGPLSGADYRRLAAALPAALKVIQMTTRELSHPAYLSGARQFDGFNTIGIKSSAMGPASFGEDGGGVEYFGLHVDFETTETDKPLDGSVTGYVGSTFVFGVGDASEILPDEIIAYSP